MDEDMARNAPMHSEEGVVFEEEEEEDLMDLDGEDEDEAVEILPE
jgi:hypothetical protein